MVRDDMSTSFRALHVVSVLLLVGSLWLWIEPTLLGKIISFAGLAMVTALSFVLFIIVSDWFSNYYYNRSVFDAKLAKRKVNFRQEIEACKNSLDYLIGQIIWCAGWIWIGFILFRMSSVAWGIFSGFVSYMRS